MQLEGEGAEGSNGGTNPINFRSVRTSSNTIEGSANSLRPGIHHQAQKHSETALEMPRRGGCFGLAIWVIRRDRRQ